MIGILKPCQLSKILSKITNEICFNIGRQLVKRLAMVSDVLVENYLPGFQNVNLEFSKNNLECFLPKANWIPGDLDTKICPR